MEQTNRTILFEEINPDKYNLLSFITDDRTESLNDDELHEIHKWLEISSFEEALEKLEPVIYLALDSDRRKVLCTKRRKDCNNHIFQEIMSVRFDSSYALLIMLIGMLNQQNGRIDIENMPENLIQNMFTLPSIDKFWEDRNQLVRYIIAGQEKRACRLLQQIQDEYDQCIFLLQVFIDSVQNMLDSKKNTDENIIMIEEKQDQQVSVFQCSRHFYMESQKLTEEHRRKINQFMELHMDDKNIKNKTLMNHLFYMDDRNRKEEIIRHYEVFLEYYREILNEYWRYSRDLLESLLGIYAFFHQYQTNNKIMPPKMVIANIKPETIIDVRYRKKLSCYLESTNQKLYYKDTIWYAVLPKLQWYDFESENIRERFRGNGLEQNRESNSVQSIQVLSNILSEYKIQVFISPNIVRKATNRYIAKHGIDEWIELQKQIADRNHASYIYPCIPNFTLLPSEHTMYQLGKKINTSEWGEVIVKEEYVKIWLRTIGIEASYVAAGLMAACQCPGYLQERFKRNTNMELPGVGYHIMIQEHNKKTYSTMRMDVLRYDKEVRDKLEQKSTGIVFMPYQKGAKILSDRAASCLYGQKDCFSDVQTVTYMEREIRIDTQDFKSTLIKKFFQKRPGSIWESWSQNPEMVNAILKKEESMEYEIDEKNNTCTFEIVLQDMPRAQVVKLNK